MDKNVAIRVSALMLDFSKQLDHSVRIVMDNCPEDELKKYRSTVGELMGIMLLDVLNPIYQEYPDLKPELLD